MGYRKTVLRGLIGQLASWREFWPGLIVLLGRCAVRADNTRTFFARLLPSKIRVRFKRFGEQQLHFDPTNGTHLQSLAEFVLDGAYDLNHVTFAPKTIIDCGAQAGFFLQLCRQHFPATPLIAFEPQAGNACFARLAAPANDTQFFEAAVGCADGTIIFDDGADGGWGAIASTDAPATRAIHVVTLVDLRRVIAGLPEGPLLLKMDIEGAEREVLPHIAENLPRQCAIFIETHHGDEGWENARSLLVSLGFSARPLRRIAHCCDGFFIRS